jgi:AraC-like DNA-binding protein
MEDIHRAAGGRVDAPHSHEYYTVIWVEDAAGEHLVDFTTYPLVPQVVFFVAPRQVHQLIPAGVPKGWVLTFSRDFLSHNHINEDFITEMDLFGHFDQRPPIYLDSSQQQQARHLFQQLEYWSQQESAYQMAALSANLKLFLILCRTACVLPDFALEQDHGGRSLLKDFRKLVSRHYTQTHKVSDYATWLHVSPKHLNQIVRNLLNQTAKEVIQEKVTLHAKRALRYTDLSIKEIAYELGFEQDSHFSAFFKKCTGQSPTAFRQLAAQSKEAPTSR